MSVGTEDFEKLSRLLKLKRHEQPPPGYFNDFSRSVLDRIEAEAQAAPEAPMWSEAPWLSRFLGLLETNPVAAGAFGVFICALLIGGIAYSQYRPPETSQPSLSTTINMAESGAVPQGADWKGASPDATAPSTAPVFGTNFLSLQPNLNLRAVNYTPAQ